MKNEATIPNPALQSFALLIGEWKTVGAHPLIPGTTFHGHTSFKWIEGGAFLIMYSETDEEGIPSGIAIFGSDDAAGEYFMQYFDERKVSRKFNVSMKDNTMKCWRDHPGFSQRMTLTITDNGNTIISKGELCTDGTTWNKDLELELSRVGSGR